jgi:hypothetical protein
MFMEITSELFLELSNGGCFEPAKYDRKDRRAASRVQISLEATVLRLSRATNAKPMAVIVINLSIRGVGFECNESFRVQEQFALRLARLDGSPVWIQCAVSRWAPINNHLFTIGANFTKILSNPGFIEAPEHYVHSGAE